MTRKNKGYVLITDALVALFFGIIIFTALLALDFSNIKMEFTEFLELHYASEDTFDVMNKKGTLDQVGHLWSISGGNTSSPAWSNMTNLTRYHLERLVPPRMGYKMIVDDIEIYNSSWNPNRTREADSIVETHASRFLVGYGENMTVLGKAARAYLSKIKGKTTSAYAYFGGFVGQGNLSRELFLPSDAGVQSAYIEVNAGSEFNLYINGNICSGPYTPFGGPMAANVKENISACNISNKGSIPNIFEIVFTNNNISQHYIGGGFIEVTYNTTQMDTDVETGTMKFYLPQIEGIINYYSSFYVPGPVTAMKSNITFKNNFTTFFTVGNTTIFRVNGSPTKQSVLNVSLETILASSEINGKTVPIRIGTEGLQYATTTSGNADIILITDVSGSMKWRIGYNDLTPGNDTRPCCPAGPWPDCLDNDSNPIFQNDTQRLALAKCLDKYFVYNILNSSGNRIGLVDFSISASDSTGLGLTNATAALNTTIDSYSAGGGTCVCCAINEAYDILQTHSSSNRSKFIIVMTDGITGYHCGNCSYTPPCGCSGGCTNTIGSIEPSCGGIPADCFGPQCNTSIDDAICASARAHDDLNVTVYSIGFGPVATGCPNANRTLRGIADCGNGSYHGSQNASELFDIYQTISQSIVASSYASQTIVVSGGNMTNSTLYGYPESYIEFTYTPHNVSGYGKISITKKSERFNEPVKCVGNISIPGNVTVSSMKVTSYSGDHWTHYLNISNSKPFTEPYKLWEAYPGVPYIHLGDPYIVHVNQPWNLINPGECNLIGIRTGDTPANDTGCSADDRAIYTVRVSSILGYGDVLPTNEGCLWDIEFSSGTTVVNLSIPSYYVGTRECSYTSSNQSYDGSDAAADAVFRLLRELDIEDDGVVDVDFDSDALQFDTSAAGKVRSLWGPIKMILVIWS